VALAKNLLFAIPFGLVAWLVSLVIISFIDVPDSLCTFLGFASADVTFRFVRRPERAFFAVPVCRDCSARLGSRAWARSWWPRALLYSASAVACFVVPHLIGDPPRLLRMGALGLLFLASALLDLASVRTRSLAQAQLVGDRVDISFSNVAFAQDVRALNHGISGAG
jgi:hypothetical protein